VTKRKFPAINYKILPSKVLEAFGHKMQAKFTHESNQLLICRNFFSVTASAGAYRNAESIKRVTVTGPYRIDRNFKSYSTVGSPIHNEYGLYATKDPSAIFKN